MATCKECLHYDVCSVFRSLSARIILAGNKADERCKLFKAADVVPRSEVAKIFAEIESLMLDGEIGGKYPAKVISPDRYSELKKKYTEVDDECV